MLIEIAENKNLTVLKERKRVNGGIMEMSDRMESRAWGWKVRGGQDVLWVGTPHHLLLFNSVERRNSKSIWWRDWE